LREGVYARIGIEAVIKDAQTAVKMASITQ